MNKSREITVTSGGDSLTFTLTRKKVKNMNMRVQRDGTVAVSASSRTSLDAIKRFVIEHMEWAKGAIARQRQRSGADQPPLSLASGEMIPIWGVNRKLLVQKGKAQASFCCESGILLFLAHPEDAAARQRAFWQFAKQEAEKRLVARATEFFSLFLPCPREMPSVEIKWMKSRWGSCTPAKNRIVLNLKLLFLPPSLADYVILHEFCHFRQANHSAAFYRELARVLPDHAARKKQLFSSCIPPIPR